MSSKRLINTEIDNLSALHDLRKNMQLFCQNQDNQDACNKVLETYNALLDDESLRTKINEAIEECLEKALAVDDFNFYKFKTTSDKEDKNRRSSANKSKTQNKDMSDLCKQIAEEIAFQAGKGKEEFKGLENAEITTAKFANKQLIIEIKDKKQPLTIKFLPYKGKLLSPLNWYNTSQKTGKKNGIMPKSLKLLEDCGEAGYVFQETSKPENLGKKYTPSEYRKFIGIQPNAELTKRQKDMLEFLNTLTLEDQQSLKNAYKLHIVRLKKYKEISDYINETPDKIAILHNPEKLQKMLKDRGIDDFTHDVQRRFVILIQRKETWVDFAKDKEDNSRRFSRYEMMENNFIASKRELFTDALQKDLNNKADVRNLVTKLFSQIKNSAKPALDNELCAEIIARGIFNEAINYNQSAQKFQNMNTLLNEMDINIDFKSLPVVKAPPAEIAGFAEQSKIDRQNFEELKHSAQYIKEDKEFNSFLREQDINKPADASTHHYLALKYNAFVEPELNNNSLLVKTARANLWNYDGHITTHMFDTAGEFLIKDDKGSYSLSNFNVLRNRFNSGEVLEIQAPVLQIKDKKSGEYKDLLSLGEKGNSGFYFSDNSTKPIIKVPPYINDGIGGNSLKKSIEK